MMAGLVPPKSLGLTDEIQIKTLLELTQRTKLFAHLNSNYLGPITGFIWVIVHYHSANSTYIMLIYSIPNAFLFSLWSHYWFNAVLNQIFVFHLICLYLKFKINALNESLLEMKRRKRFIRIRETLQSFDSLYSEINEYNTTIWSKFLAFFWLTFGIAIIIFILMFLLIVDNIVLTIKF